MRCDIFRKSLGALATSYRLFRSSADPRNRSWDDARIALVKLDGIGDFVLATTALHFLGQHLPNADITLVCRQPLGCLARQQFPQWTVLELPPRDRPLRAIYAQPTARRMLKSQPRFDLLLDLRTFRDMSDSAVASWIPAGIKVAFKNAYPPSLSWVVAPCEDHIYDVLLPLPQAGESQTVLEIQNYRTLLEYFFAPQPGIQTAMPKLAASENEREQLAKRFPGKFEKPFLLVCPGAYIPTKEYPVKPLAAALRQVLEKHPMPVMLAGGKSDERTILPLLAELQEIPALTNLCGQLNLAEHVALVSMARAVVSMDSCHAHIAGALGVPALAIIGGGHFGIFAPWGESPTFRWITNKLPCFGCHWQCIYDRPLCIQDIAPETIATQIDEVLTFASRGAPSL